MEAQTEIEIEAREKLDKELHEYKVTAMSRIIARAKDLEEYYKSEKESLLKERENINGMKSIPTSVRAY